VQSEYIIDDGVIISGRSCVYLPDISAVAVSDLHLGYEVYMESEGLFLPRMQLNMEISRIQAILDEYAPEIFIINGDLKQEFSRNTPQEWIEIKHLFSLLTERMRVVVVRGNHDNYILNIASLFQIPVVQSCTMDRILFAHGDVLIEGSKARWTIIGHEHPAIRIRDEIGAQTKYPAFISFHDGLLVLPAFSPFAAGTDVATDWSGMLSPYLTARKGDEAMIFAVCNGKVKRLGQLSSIRAAQC